MNPQENDNQETDLTNTPPKEDMNLNETPSTPEGVTEEPLATLSTSEPLDDETASISSEPPAMPSPQDVIRPGDQSSSTSSSSSGSGGGSIFGSSSSSGSSSSREPSVAPSEPTPAASQVESEKTDSSASAGSAKSKKSKLPLVLLILLLLVAGGVAAYYFLVYSKDDNSTSQSANTEQKYNIETLRVAFDEGSMNTFAPLAVNNSHVQVMNAQIFEGLTKYENQTKVEQLLATSWYNTDETTWVFTIKQGVTFHNGTAMTAEKVKDALLYYANTENENTSYFADTIENVTVSGDNQVTIKTSTPDPLLIDKLTYLYIFDVDGKDKNSPLNGTGPMTLKADTTPTEKKIELSAATNYHGDQIYVQNLTMEVIDDHEVSIERFNKGEIDIVTAVRPEEEKDFTAENTTVESKTLEVGFLVPNVLKADAPLAKLKVREALLYALDMDALMKVRGDEGTAVRQLVSELVPGYNPEVTPVERDVNKAKQLLKEAGYADGATIELTFFEPAKDTAEEIKRQLAEAGITINLDSISEVPVLADKAFGGKADMYFFTFTSDFLDATSAYESLLYESANYQSEEVTKLIEEAKSEFDPSKRIAKLQELAKVVSDDVAVVPLYTPNAGIMVTKPSIQLSVDLTLQGGAYFTHAYSTTPPNAAE